MTTVKGARCGLLGERLAHSYSPVIHRKLGNTDYRLFEADAARAAEIISGADYDWLNVTIPYKLLAKSLCDELSETARRTGSVNTVIPRDGKLLGFNTDYDGFKRMLLSKDVCVTAGKSVILGNGGAARTVRAVLEDMGAPEVVTVTRGGSDNFGNLAVHADARIIVNATPLGMYPDILGSPCDLTVFEKPLLVLDLVYNPLRTMLLQQAERLGISSSNGLLMLVNQAMHSSALYSGAVYSPDTDIRISKQVASEKRNTVIIGMPGGGKTMLAKALSSASGREMLDTDRLVELSEGKSIAEIFNSDGEKSFRKAEEAAVMYALSGGGRIIAVGGGAVLSEKNRAVIRANSFVIYLDTPNDLLDRSARPLSSSDEAVEVMYRERLPLYKETSDITVRRTENIQNNIDFILEAMQ